MKLNKQVVEKVNEYIQQKDKLDNIQKQIMDQLQALGIDTESIKFSQIVGDIFSFGELESVQQLEKSLDRFIDSTGEGAKI